MRIYIWIYNTLCFSTTWASQLKKNTSVYQYLCWVYLIELWSNRDTQIAWVNIGCMIPPICICYHYKQNNDIRKVKHEIFGGIKRTWYSHISPGSMVTFRCLLHTCSHSGGGSKNHVFLPWIMACQDGLFTASIYITQKTYCNNKAKNKLKNK